MLNLIKKSLYEVFNFCLYFNILCRVVQYLGIHFDLLSLKNFHNGNGIQLLDHLYYNMFISFNF